MIRTPRYSMEEHARRGEAMYWSRVHPLVKDLPPQTVIALDIETGEFETSEDDSEACDRLLARLPEAQVWSVRVGHEPVVRFGFLERKP